MALPLTYVKEELVDGMRGGDSFLLDRCGPKIVPYDIKTPKDYDSAVAKLHTDRWARWIRRQHPTLTLYDLRHAWAIRSITKMIPTSLAAKCMGHRVIVHHETYHRCLDQSDIAAVAAWLK